MLVHLVAASFDLMMAILITLALACTLPILTFGTSALLHYLSRPKNASAPVPSPPSEDAAGSLATGMLLFVVKGLVLFVALVQCSVELGGAAACWACASLIEWAARTNDSSLLVLTTPPLGALDVVFLLLVAPALAAPAGGVHGIGAAWLLYLCAAYCWRASPSSSVTVPMALTAAAYLFAWAVGLLEWRSHATTLGLTPADDSLPQTALLAAGVAIVHLLPTHVRYTLMPTALALSPTFRNVLKAAAHAIATQLSRLARSGLHFAAGGAG